MGSWRGDGLRKGGQLGGREEQRKGAQLGGEEQRKGGQPEGRDELSVGCGKSVSRLCRH